MIPTYLALLKNARYKLENIDQQSIYIIMNGSGTSIKFVFERLFL